MQYEVARLKKGGGKAGGGGGGGKPKSGIFKAFGSMGKGKSKKKEEEEVRLVRSELAKERRLREEDKAKHVRELDAVQRQHSQALKRAAAATTDDGREGGVVEAAACTDSSTCCNLVIPTLPLTTTQITSSVCNQGSYHITSFCILK